MGMTEAELASVAHKATEAQQRLREAVLMALRDGVPRMAIHRATGLSRATINRWDSEGRK